jgi:hypothetical protein
MGLLGAKDGLERCYLRVCKEGSGEKELWTTIALFVATRGQGGVVGHFGMQLKVSCTHTHIYLYNIPGWSSFRGRSAVTALGDETSFGPPFVLCVLELSRKSPCLWACFHSLSPL